MKKIKPAIKYWYDKVAGFDVPILLGRNHCDRVMVLPWLGKQIPKEIKSSMYFTGQGQLPIIPLSLAKCISKHLRVDVSLFSVKC